MKPLQVPIFDDDISHDDIQHTFHNILRKMNLPADVESRTLLKIQPEFDSPFQCSSTVEPTNYAVLLTPLAIATTLESALAKIESILDPRSKQFFFNLSHPTIQRMVADVSYFSPQRIEFLIAHELTHIKNEDLSITSILKLGFFANTLRSKYAAICHEREFAADANAVAVLGVRGAIGAIEHLAKTHLYHTTIHRRMLELGLNEMAARSEQSRQESHPTPLARAQRVCEAARALGMSEEELVATAVRVGTMPGQRPAWRDGAKLADLFTA